MEHEAILKERAMQAEQAQVSSRLRGGAIPGRPLGVLDNAKLAQDCCASESLQSRAMSKAHRAAGDAVRHERLAEMLTPEIERTLFVLQECIALGLIDVRFIADALEREHRLGRDRF